MKDFCNLYEYDKNTFTLLNSFKLGTDLSSDINDMDVDDRNLYVSIRNGILAIIDKRASKIEYIKVSDYSMWDITVTKEMILAGDVNGNLIPIDKKTFLINSILFIKEISAASC